MQLKIHWLLANREVGGSLRPNLSSLLNMKQLKRHSVLERKFKQNRRLDTRKRQYFKSHVLPHLLGDTDHLKGR